MCNKLFAMHWQAYTRKKALKMTRDGLFSTLTFVFLVYWNNIFSFSYDIKLKEKLMQAKVNKEIKNNMDVRVRTLTQKTRKYFTALLAYNLVLGSSSSYFEGACYLCMVIRSGA